MFDLTQIAHHAAPWLDKYGYAAVAVGVAVEGVGVPLPGATLMGGAALLAGQGDMRLSLVLLTAWLAAMVGDNLGYWIGRRGGRRLLLKVGVRRRRLQRLQRFFRRYGLALILFGRFFDGTRQLDGLVAGSVRMPWMTFFRADAVGSAMWVSFWVFGLYTLDRHFAAVRNLLSHINPWVAGVAVTAVVILVIALKRRSSDRHEYS